MRWLGTLAVVVALMSPTTAPGQYTFGDWARDHGYSPGDVMPGGIGASWSSPAIDSLSDIEFEAFRLILTKMKGIYPDKSILRPEWI